MTSWYKNNSKFVISVENRIRKIGSHLKSRKWWSYETPYCARYTFLRFSFDFAPILFKHFCVKIFICLDIYMMLKNVPCVNIWFCHQKCFCTYLSTKTHTLLVQTLRTKSDIRTKIYTLKHRINIQADKNFRTKMDMTAQNVQKRTNLYKNLYRMQRPVVFKLQTDRLRRWNKRQSCTKPGDWKLGALPCMRHR